MAKTAPLQIETLYKNVLDDYTINGFNGVKAVQKYKPNITYSSAGRLYSDIVKSDIGQKYLEQKRAELKRSTSIQNENILKELMTWAYSNIKDFITLTPEEVKELPDEVTRCIQSYIIKKKTYYNKQLRTEVTEETITLKLVDKIQAMQQIAKHIGFYEVDNKQKATKIDISKLSINVLNEVLQLTKEDNNTIDIGQE